MAEIDFSIVMPTYNQDLFIEKSIKSVVNQTHSNWELLIVDNYSEDKTEKIVSSFDDERIRYFKFKNKGVIAASRNYAIKQAKGDFVAFLDSDDLWMPNKLHLIKAYIDKNQNCTLVYHKSNKLRGQLIISPQRKKYFSGKIYNRLLFDNFIGTLSVVVRKSVLNSIGIFDEKAELKGAEDWDLWIRIAKKHNIDFLDEVLALYREHDSATSKNPDTMTKCSYGVIKKHLIEDQDLSAKLKKQMMAHHFYQAAIYYYQSKRFSQSRTYLYKSIGFYPFKIEALLLLLKNLLRTIQTF